MSNAYSYYSNISLLGRMMVDFHNFCLDFHGYNDLNVKIYFVLNCTNLVWRVWPEIKSEQTTHIISLCAEHTIAKSMGGQ